MKTKLEIMNDKCSSTDKQGRIINICKDEPILTYCPRCKSVYLVNEDDTVRTEINMKLEELLRFIKQQEE